MSPIQNDREIYCSVDAPGFNAGDFDVQVCGNSVKISAATQNNAPTVDKPGGRFLHFPVAVARTFGTLSSFPIS